ncbi:MAG: DUF1559 domain-containing protein, partial [Patescibacteria group bacterium]|nr:DUF1559 domain-containing protein [Patescibacteria group bacterium]
VDGKGNPLHSWRVLLLPYLGHQGLYEKLRLDEPWDSEHNRQFHGEDLAVYRCPSDPVAGPGQATYSVVVGPDVAFQAGQGKRLADVGSHGADLILLVERMEPVGWMEPAQEITQADADLGARSILDDSSSGLEPIGSHHWGGNHSGFRSGGVRSLSPYWYDSDPLIDSQDALQGFQRMLRGGNAPK